MFMKNGCHYKKLPLNLVIIILLALFVAIWTQTSLVKAEKVGTAIGNKAPAFTLADLNGKQVALSGVVTKNKVTVINFGGSGVRTVCARSPIL